jgi:hypothetical protein
VHHAHQRLPRREAADHLRAERLFLHCGNEVAHHWQRNIGLEQRDTHLAQRLLDIGLGQTRLATNRLDDSCEARGQVVEHGVIN